MSEANYRGKCLALTRAYYATKAYKGGTKNKRSLVGEKYYEEFSKEFWKEPGMTASSKMPRRSQLSRIPRATSVGVLSRPKTYSESKTDSKYGTDSRSGTASGKIPKAVPSPNISRSTTPDQ